MCLNQLFDPLLSSLLWHAANIHVHSKGSFMASVNVWLYRVCWKDSGKIFHNMGLHCMDGGHAVFPMGVKLGRRGRGALWSRSALQLHINRVQKQVDKIGTIQSSKTRMRGVSIVTMTCSKDMQQRWYHHIRLVSRSWKLRGRPRLPTQ